MPIDGPETHGSTYDAVLAALAHPARRRMLLALYFNGGSMSAGQIATMFEHAGPTTSRHLLVLRDAGLVTARRHGRGRTYALDTRHIQLVMDWLRWFVTPLDQHQRPL